MSVVVKEVVKGSVAERYGIRPLDTLISINKNEIIDVLDYRFFQQEEKLKVCFINSKGKKVTKKIKKSETEELGLCFETYLMDKQHSCKNKCIFCFIDQLPKGMRESLYFKDDDSRLSFLFGNYITLTNITEHEVERIIKMHISPVNISVHTTNPELRVKIMKNRFAGESLSVLWRLAEAGIKINCQLVLMPGINDGKELERSLNDLLKYPSVLSIACVPVGVTKYRENLPKLETYTKETAEQVINIVNKFGKECLKKFNSRKVYVSDEFYLLAEQKTPEFDFYEDFPQLENGVGLITMLEKEALDALSLEEETNINRMVSCVAGEAAYALISKIVDIAKNKWHNLNCKVFAIKNNFFGEKINVSGLVVGQDIINQLKGKELGTVLLVPAVMLRRERDMFLDNVTVAQLEKELNIKVRIVENDGFDLIDALKG